MMALAQAGVPVIFPPTAALHAPHVLVTLDAVGGVWRYAMDLASGLAECGFRFTFAGFGPAPSPAQRAEAERFGRLIWFDAPLDWTTGDERQLDAIPELLRDVVETGGIDLVHLNLPSQACGLRLDVPVLAVSHSCVVTWFAAVRQTAVPPAWQWHYRRNREGFDRADAVVAPSHAHAGILRASYGRIDNLEVVYNGSRAPSAPVAKEALVFSAGRWWDDGKNGALLDEAAAGSAWPVAMAGAVSGPNGQFCPLRHARSLGEIAHAEVERWMARAAIVASPSRYEPFGLAPLEAARAGAALVLADNPTYRELWDGAALFAAPDDARGFADAINRFASDDALRHEFAARARQRSSRYALEAQVAAMASVYDRLLQPVMAREA
jgi:glycosyltransferase involved in cell wall biosynthesis